jgi:hypothetical protein
VDFCNSNTRVRCPGPGAERADGLVIAANQFLDLAPMQGTPERRFALEWVQGHVLMRSIAVQDPIPGCTKTAGDQLEHVRDVFLVVPAVELLIMIWLNGRPDNQDMVGGHGLCPPPARQHPPSAAQTAKFNLSRHGPSSSVTADRANDDLARVQSDADLDGDAVVAQRFL